MIDDLALPRRTVAKTAKIQRSAVSAAALLFCGACAAPQYAGPEAGLATGLEIVPLFGAVNSAGDLEVLIYKNPDGCVDAMRLAHWNQGYFSKESEPISATIPANTKVALEIGWSGSGVAAGTGNYIVSSTQIIEFEPESQSTYRLTTKVENDRTGWRLSRLEAGDEYAVPVRELKTTHGGSAWRGGRKCEGNVVLQETH